MYVIPRAAAWRGMDLVLVVGLERFRDACHQTATVLIWQKKYLIIICAKITTQLKHFVGIFCRQILKSTIPVPGLIREGGASWKSSTWRVVRNADTRFLPPIYVIPRAAAWSGMDLVLVVGLERFRDTCHHIPLQLRHLL